MTDTDKEKLELCDLDSDGEATALQQPSVFILCGWTEKQEYYILLNRELSVISKMKVELWYHWEYLAHPATVVVHRLYNQVGLRLSSLRYYESSSSEWRLPDHSGYIPPNPVSELCGVFSNGVLPSSYGKNILKFGLSCRAITTHL